MTTYTDGQPETRNDVTPFADLGMKWTGLYQGFEADFVYVKVVDANVVKGDVVHLTSVSSPYTVSRDRAGGASGPPLAGQHTVIGVAVGAITAGRYGFVMVRGYHDAVKTGTSVGAIAIGDTLRADPTVDGEAFIQTTPLVVNESPFATALAASAGGAATTIPALIHARGG